MKYLLYYNLDSKFIADQTSVGGDGTKVVSVVDGVAWTNDQEKAYYRLANNDSENLTSYTVTVHYRTFSGVQLAPDDTFVVDAYIGKGVKKVVESKIIDGYKTAYVTKTLNVYDDTEYTFRYRAIPNLEEPLTFNIISAGTIYWVAYNTAYTTTIEYSTDSGETWTSITSNTGNSAPYISVSAGDVVQFRGNNAAYSSGSSRYNYFRGSSARFEVEGNIMSLIDSENFASAITLVSSYTFYFLFYNCTGLTSAENLLLPATTLANYCYRSMFNSCRGLTTAPELPATTLAIYCYENMFGGCTGLTAAPELPATTLADFCYMNMFQGCRNLTTAPELPATTLAARCYGYMFSGCTNLTTAPSILPATTLANYCYVEMFRGTSLTKAPELPATTLANDCYYSMFADCRSLTSAPALPATTLTYNCYSQMFYGCTSLTKAPELPATTLATDCYQYMFRSCTSLTTAPSILPAPTLNDYCYQYMFSGCTSLITAPALPATTLKQYCYSGMFAGCTSLTSAPELPATTLTASCYSSMFSGCRSLNYIKCLATNISASYCTYNWVYNVSSSGTFVKNPNMSSWTTGVNGIPSNWTVQDNV